MFGNISIQMTNEIPEGLESLRSQEGVKLDQVSYLPPENDGSYVQADC